MRVLHICSGNLYGGVETILVTLARERSLCPAMSSEYSVCFEGRFSEELEAEGAAVHKIGGVRVRNPMAVRRARGRLREILSQGRFDIAVCHSAWSQVIFGPAVRAEGVALLRWLHDVSEGRHWLDRWARTTPPDHVICCSEFTAGHSRELFGKTPSDVVYCPVPTPRPSSDPLKKRQELEASDGAAVILQVSRMEEWKGHKVHLEALGRLCVVPGWVCWMAGGAERPKELAYLEELREDAKRLGIEDRVRFLGKRSDVGELLSAADIFCQPNTKPEAFGIVFAEAMLARIPVVTTAIGGGQEIVEKASGKLVAPRDPVALAEELRVLITNSGFRREIGKQGRERALELCAPEAQIDKIERVLRGVVERKKQPRTVAVRKAGSTPAGKSAMRGASLRRTNQVRVLHLCSGNLYGGVESFLLTLARWAPACPDMISEFSVCFDGRLKSELEAADARVHYLGAVRLRNPVAAAHARAELRKVLLDSDFDVVISHSEWTQVLFGNVVREAGVPLFFWPHDPPDGRHWLQRWARQTRADLAICASHFVADLWSNWWPETPAQVVFYPVAPPDAGNFAVSREQVRAELGVPSNSVVILQASRMEAWKGHHQHFETLARMIEIPGWFCWIAGGAQRQEERRYFEGLQKMVKNLGLEERIRFLGQRKDVGRLMAAADIYCQANTGPETFGRVFVEALWMGLPVVTTRLGAAPEILDPTCSVVVRPGEIAELADALTRLVTETQRRAEMSEAARVRGRALCDPASGVKSLAGVIHGFLERRSAA